MIMLRLRIIRYWALSGGSQIVLKSSLTDLACCCATALYDIYSAIWTFHFTVVTIVMGSSQNLGQDEVLAVITCAVNH